jgi:hypothetical protein
MEAPWGFLEHDEVLLFPLSENYEQPPEVLFSSRLMEDLPSSLPAESCRTFKTRHGDVVFVELDFPVSSNLF